MDLWPYINGKAITLGLKLTEMEVYDMLDVIHFFFEEDHRFSSAEEAEGVDLLRTSLYLNLYGETYRHKASKSSNASASSGDRQYVSNSSYEFNDLPDSAEVKSFVPPTEFNENSAMPFGSALDAPIG